MNVAGASGKHGCLAAVRWVYRDGEYGGRWPVASIGCHSARRFRGSNCEKFKVPLADGWVAFKSPSYNPSMGSRNYPAASTLERSSEALDRMKPTAKLGESAAHEKVLNSLKKLKVAGHEVLIEEKGKEGSRLYLPNQYFRAEKKAVAQRKINLCYADSVIHAERELRVLIEVVDNSPATPNGITGLTVNVDRIADIHPDIDLLFVVLADMKNFYCSACGAGHRLSNRNKASCLRSYLGSQPDDNSFTSLIHEGKAANFKKALINYPISDYLLNISPPSVIFLNRSKVVNAWHEYESTALNLIELELSHVLSSGKRSETRLVGVRELIPHSILTRSS